MDSVDQWPYLSGKTSKAPRNELPIGSTANPKDIWASHNDIVVRTIIQQDPADHSKIWKLMLGQEPNAVWTGPRHPNATSATQRPSEKVFADCGYAPGCLFELGADPAEHEDVAAANPEVVKRLREALEAHNKTVFAPRRPSNPAGCDVALSRYKDPNHDFGWWGPFAEHLAQAQSNYV